MLKVEAATLEEAYSKASYELNCSVTDLEVTIVQNPSNGFLGLFKKNAVLIAVCKGGTKACASDQPKAQIKETVRQQQAPSNANIASSECDAIALRLNKLFASSCYKINEIKAYYHDEQTVTVEFQGDDAALLIGKEGHRYKALSYLLFNWIHTEYGFYVRLEIADFLKNQETQLKAYLQDVIEQVHVYGKAHTKPLDSVLAPLALKDLRSVFPNKYVALKSEFDGTKSIVIDEFWGQRA